MTHVLTITFDSGSTTEVHMVNPGEPFHGFGGSSQALVPQVTASLILRRRSAEVGDTYDTEHNIHDPAVWTMLARMMGDNEIGRKYTVTVPAPPPPKFPPLGKPLRPQHTAKRYKVAQAEVDAYIARATAEDEAISTE